MTSAPKLPEDIRQGVVSHIIRLDLLRRQEFRTAFRSVISHSEFKKREGHRSRALWDVIVARSEAYLSGRSMATSDIHLEIGISRTTVGRCIRILTELGVFSLSTDSADQRRTLIEFTEPCRTILDQYVNECFVEFEDLITHHHDSERLKAENALRASEAHVSLLMDSTAEGIYGVDLDGNCTFANSACRSILGFEEQSDLVGVNMHNLIHHTRKNGSEYPIEECHIYEAFRRGEGTHIDDEVLWRSNGTSFPAEYRSYPIKRKNEVVGAVVTFTDITERKQAENLLSESEERFRHAAQSAGDAIISANGNGEIIFWNQAAQRLFGYHESETVGQPITKLMTEPWRSKHTAAFGRVNERGELRVLDNAREVTCLTKEGNEVPVEISLSSWSVGGERFYTAIIHDIAQRKRIEQERTQSEKLKAVGRLTGGVAHEFNNMLQALLGNLELVRDQINADSEASHWLESAVDIVRRGGRLTQQLVAYSSQQLLRPRTVNVNDLIGGMVDNRLRALGVDIGIETRLADDPWPVLVDPDALESAILSLALNGSQAMPNGGVLTLKTDNVRLEERLPDCVDGPHAGNYVTINVVDTGHGMTPGEMERAFDPFFTAKDVGEGFGLGLSTVQGFVKQSGGFVNIQSTPGKGTTVKILLPAATQREPVGAPGKTDETATYRDAEGD